MARHSKNCTNSAVYSYHERKQDTKRSGYGTKKERLNKDAVKNFNACNLTLQACRMPVITPEGVLYDKESILEYILRQKMEISKKMKKYDKEQKKRQREIDEKEEKNVEEKANKFAKLEENVFHDKEEAASSSTTSSVSNMINGKEKEMPSFWTPASGPSNKAEVVEKPSEEIKCPISGKPLKTSKLITVIFTPVDAKETDHLKQQYMCAVTHDLLTNSSKCVVLKTSGSVVTQECVDKIVKKDMVDPINGKKMKESDFIPLQQGGTGYASANRLEAAVKKPAMMTA